MAQGLNGIHASAIIDDGAQIGEGTKIWHWTHVMDAEIGKDCMLGQGVFIGEGVTIGDGCSIQNNVSVYSGVTLGDYVFVGPHVTFTNVKRPRAVKPVDEYVSTTVGNYASIGANATIICGVTIGAGAMIGAGAVVTKDVEAGATVTGNPAEGDTRNSTMSSELIRLERKRKIKFYATDKWGDTHEITDLYWFEENYTHWFDDADMGAYTFEVWVRGIDQVAGWVKVYP